jgi:hypothetical protein
MGTPIKRAIIAKIPMMTTIAARIGEIAPSPAANIPIAKAPRK